MKLPERAYLKLSAVAPPALSARMDMVRATSLAGGALNGQRLRQQIVRHLVATIEFDEVVETGTFRAATTLFFSHLTGLPVHSVELLPRFFRLAETRCSDYPDIHLRLGDSRDFLVDLSREISEHTTLFYLDAHWQPDVPRFEELEIISSAWNRAVVMIDDFAVPDDPGYGFTRYGETPLTIDYLPSLPGWAMFYPAARADVESGARRGCLVLASPDVSGQVDKVPSLRPVDREPGQWSAGPCRPTGSRDRPPRYGSAPP
jgi:hypothetical protein